MPSHTALPGFRDFYPADFTVRSHIMTAWREAAEGYGFEAYDGPPLESLELYTEKSGEEIVRQLYHFEDKGGRAVALRPEMTPTLARMVGAHAGSLRKPIRWFSMPQLFRYERTQRGRLREHFQWNVDILGEDDIAADAEVLAVALDALRRLGLGDADIVARYNDRRLLEHLLTGVGVPAARLVAAYGVIDKLTREPADRIRARLHDEVGLAADTAAAVLRIFEHPDLATLDAAYGDQPGVREALGRLTSYHRHLDALGFGAFLRFDPAIVRGLAYYTGTVFEIFDRAGELRAICGGGRYDRLLHAVSTADLPAVGFGMGDVVLTELLRARDLLPVTAPSVDVYLVTVAADDRPRALQIAQALRVAGLSVIYSLRPLGVGKQLKDADARGARHALVLGPEELARGVAIRRDMSDGTQQDVPLDDLLVRARELLT